MLLDQRSKPLRGSSPPPIEPKRIITFLLGRSNFFQKYFFSNGRHWSVSNGLAMVQTGQSCIKALSETQSFNHLLGVTICLGERQCLSFLFHVHLLRSIQDSYAGRFLDVYPPASDCLQYSVLHHKNPTCHVMSKQAVFLSFLYLQSKASHPESSVSVLYQHQNYLFDWST